MRFGDFFEKEWYCDFYPEYSCWGPEDKKQLNQSLHERCGWRYVASLSEDDFYRLKDARLD